MKIKTNLRAGAKSGTVASGSKKSNSTSPEVEISSPESVSVSTTTRCAGF